MLQGLQSQFYNSHSLIFEKLNISNSFNKQPNLTAIANFWANIFYDSKNDLDIYHLHLNQYDQQHE